jgi:hypothetical protein
VAFSAVCRSTKPAPRPTTGPAAGPAVTPAAPSGTAPRLSVSELRRACAVLPTPGPAADCCAEPAASPLAPPAAAGASCPGSMRVRLERRRACMSAAVNRARAAACGERGPPADGSGLVGPPSGSEPEPAGAGPHRLAAMSASEPGTGGLSGPPALNAAAPAEPADPEVSSAGAEMDTVSAGGAPETPPLSCRTSPIEPSGSTVTLQESKQEDQDETSPEIGRQLTC